MIAWFGQVCPQGGAAGSHLGRAEQQTPADAV
jgi:hypothetical protein